VSLPPPDPHTAKFLDALNNFMENPPRDLPDGAAEMLKEVSDSLKGYNDTGHKSPGEQEAAKFTDGTGNPYPNAAKREDQPSPGQKEFERVIKQAQAEAMARMASSNGDAT
jgi:hypothetical protein